MRAHDSVGTSSAPGIIMTAKAALCAAFVLCAWPACAQSGPTVSAGFNSNAGRGDLFRRDRSVAVLQRRQPEFEPLPISAGGSDLYLQADATVTATNNQLADNNSKNSDLSGEVGVSALDRYSWASNQLTAFARGSVRRFVDNSNDDVELYGAGLASTFGVGTPGTTIQVGGQYIHDAISRLATESALTSASIIEVDDATAFVGGTAGNGALRLWGKGSYRIQRFSQNGGVVGQSEFRDRDVIEAEGQVEYAVTPSLYWFGNLLWDRRDFKVGGVTGSRDSRGVEVTGGINVELSAFARVDARVGYISRTFSNPVYSDIGGIAYRLKAEYFPSQLLTLTANARREVRDSSRVGVGAFVSDDADVTADVEYLRNLVLSARAGIGQDKYRGFDLSYKRISAGLAVRYVPSRAWKFQGGLNFDHRAKSGPAIGRSYDVASLLFSASYRF